MPTLPLPFPLATPSELRAKEGLVIASYIDAHIVTLSPKKYLPPSPSTSPSSPNCKDTLHTMQQHLNVQEKLQGALN